MVEYALILAHNASSLIPQDFVAWASELRWESLGYAALALLALRLAVWAFRPNH
jgi:hypothetical protein